MSHIKELACEPLCTHVLIKELPCNLVCVAYYQLQQLATGGHSGSPPPCLRSHLPTVLLFLLTSAAYLGQLFRHLLRCSLDCGVGISESIAGFRTLLPFAVLPGVTIADGSTLQFQCVLPCCWAVHCHATGTLDFWDYSWHFWVRLPVSISA
mgnify:CR=1 FL=1